MKWHHVSIPDKFFFCNWQKSIELKASAITYGSFTSSSFLRRVGICSVRLKFSCFIFYYILGCFYLISQFCHKPAAILSSSLFHNCAWNFAILNVICCHVWIITAPAIYICRLFYVCKKFYSLCNPLNLHSTYTFILYRKTNSKDIYKNIHKKELNLYSE
jgi:hypothetical protein